MDTLSRHDLKRLTSQAREGDRQAFSILYEATWKAQYFTALSVLKDGQMAEDAVQNAYLKAMEYIGSLENTDNFLSWIGKITYHCCMDILRKKKRVDTSFEDETVLRIPDPDAASNPLGTAITNEKQENLLKLVSELKTDHRTVVLLRYYYNMKVKEIADIMECSEGTVKSRIHYALKQLKERLASSGLSRTDYLFGVGPLLTYTYRTSAPAIPGCQKHLSGRTVKTASFLAVCSMVLLGGNYYFTPPVLTDIRVEKSEGYVNHSPNITFRVKGRTPDTVAAVYRNGEAVPVAAKDSGKYSLQAIRNGTINLSIHKDGKTADVKEIQVANIDMTAPSMGSYSLSGETVRIHISDDLSGINYDLLKITTASGKLIPKDTVVRKKNYIELPYNGNEALVLHLADNAGNSCDYDIFIRKK